MWKRITLIECLIVLFIVALVGLRVWGLMVEERRPADPLSTAIGIVVLSVLLYSRRAAIGRDFDAILPVLEVILRPIGTALAAVAAVVSRSNAFKVPDDLTSEGDRQHVEDRSLKRE